MMKNILKFLLLVVATTIAASIAAALLPYSDSFKAANKDPDPSILLFVLLTHAWTCMVIVYVARHSRWEKTKLFLGLTGMLFFVYAFMMQIETFFFSGAFPALTNTDIVLITIANGISFFVAVPLGIKLFGKRQDGGDPSLIWMPGTKELTIKLSLIGIIYVIVYFVFGYFVAWQTEELRIFYSGQPDDFGFIGGLVNNYHERPAIYPFQFMRGVLFGLFAMPLVSMFRGQSRQLLISLVMVYTGTGLALIIPNFLFPDAVRWAHFREMISSMFFFSIMVWLIYDKLNWFKKTVVQQKPAL
jgi:hypothetical protein